MAVQAQFGGLLLPPPYAVEEEQMRALKDYGVLFSAAAATTPGGDDGYACQQYDYFCAAQSELTCNNGGGGAFLPLPSRKRGRDDDLQHYNVPLLLLPGTRSPAAADRSRTAAPSTSGRPAEAPAPAVSEHALAAPELWRHGVAAEVDALVRAECGRLRAGLELVQAAASGSLARRAREAEAQLEAARRRAAELEERVRLAAAEAQAWCDVARGNEAVAAGLRATLDALLLRSSSAAAAAAAGEGFGDSEPDDAQSCCCDVDVEGQAAASSSWNGKWACRACGGGEASVLVLPCRHLCLCKACERRTDACPVCSGDKNASIHIAPS